MDLKEGKEASLPWKWQNIDLEEEEITSPEEGETCERERRQGGSHFTRGQDVGNEGWGRGMSQLMEQRKTMIPGRGRTNKRVSPPNEFSLLGIPLQLPQPLTPVFPPPTTPTPPPCFPPPNECPPPKAFLLQYLSP